MLSGLQHRWRHVSIAVLCAVLFSASGCISRHLDRDWIEVRSENFAITSDMRREEAEELARELELFRAAVLLMTRASATESNIPTRVFFFARESSFRPFRHRRGVGGYLLPTMRANFVAIVDSRDMDAVTILRHEYVHFLVRNGSSRVYPKWFDEGFAELLSTTEQMGAHVAVGQLPKERVAWLRAVPWMPMRDVLTFDGTQRKTSREVLSFYAQSWALLHYLTRDFYHAVRLSGAVEKYIDRIESGTDLDKACQIAFGKDVEGLDEAVRQHLERGSFTPFGVRKDRLAYSTELRSRALDRAEVAERLGELALHSGGKGYAESFFREAIASDPGNARAYAGLADILMSRDEWTEADPLFDRAVELGPKDPLNLLDRGKSLLHRASEVEDAETRQSLIERARPYFTRAIDIDEWKPEPWAVYGASYLEEGQDAAQGVEWLEQALQLLPSNTQIQLWLAEAYAKTEEDEQARRLLRRIVAWGHSEEVSERARELLEDLGKGDGESPGAARSSRETEG